MPQDKLPALHAFVDVAVTGRAMRSVSVEDVAAKTIVVARCAGRARANAAPSCIKTRGASFRFSTNIVHVKERHDAFSRAATHRSRSAGHVKSAPACGSTCSCPAPGAMRPAARARASYIKGSIRDISRGGCALIVDRQCKAGSWLEVRMNSEVARAARCCVLGEVVRIEQIPTSGKFSHGLRFQGSTPEEDRAILEFITRKQTELRNRWLEPDLIKTPPLAE